MEDLGCLVHMPGPDGEGWKLYLELAADYGRMTGNSDVTRLGKGCRQLTKLDSGVVSVMASLRQLSLATCPQHRKSSCSATGYS